MKTEESAQNVGIFVSGEWCQDSRLSHKRPQFDMLGTEDGVPAEKQVQLLAGRARLLGLGSPRTWKEACIRPPPQVKNSNVARGSLSF
jgi:hypothetical protein